MSPKKEYVGRSKIPQVNCLCPDCENVALLRTGINKCCESMEIPTKCHDLALKIACDPITEKYVTKDCVPSLDLVALQDCSEVCFCTWKKGEKYYEKQLTENTGEEVKDLLNEQIDYVKVHYFRKRIQDATYREHIKGLKDGEFVIHVDYSKNYKNKQQSEIKAGYYGQGQFSLFTVVVYIKQNGDIVCKNYALATPENDHSCNISFRLKNFILSTCRLIVTLKLSNFGLMAVLHNSVVSLPSSCSQNLIIQSTLNGTILKQTMERML